MSNLDKSAILNLKNTAHGEKRWDTNVVFSDADQESAVLRFKLLKDDGLPYIIGNVNVGGKIKLDHEDKSFWIDDLTVIENELKYQFEYRLPDDLLKRDGSVTAQVLIYEKGTSNLVVAQRIFKFNISNSIYQNLSAETKTMFISTFADLQQEIRKEVTDIQESIASSQDYVTEIKEVHSDGIEAIQTLVTTSTDDLKQLSENNLNELQTKATNYIEQIDNKNADAQKSLDDFKNYLIDLDVVTNKDAESWQRFKLTEENGNRIRISDIDPIELDTGYYQCWRTKNMPMGDDGAGSYWNIDVTTAYDGVKQIKAVLSYTGQTFLKNVHKSEEGAWREVPLFEDISTLETSSSSQEKATTAENNAREYTDSRHRVLFNGNVSGVNSTIKLEDDYTEYSLLVISGDFPGGEWTKAHLVANTRSIHVTEINLLDSDAAGGGIYEMLIRKKDARTLEIGLDNYMEITSNTGYTDTNKFTVQRIEGWK